MRHEEIRDKLAALHDAELSPAENAALRAHLGICTECRTACQNWSRIAAAFLRAPSRPPAHETEAFVRRFMARLERPKPVAASWFTTGLRWLVPAVSVALAASALLITRPDPMFTPPEDVALLADGPGLSPQAAEPTTDDLVAMVMEKE